MESIAFRLRKTYFKILLPYTFLSANIRDRYVYFSRNVRKKKITRMKTDPIKS